MSPLADRFLALHRAGSPLLMPNAADAGTARLLAALGFAAVASTSSGFAFTLGRSDGSVSRDEALGHAGALAAAVDVPVSADLENCFADAPAEVADTVQQAVAAGLAGCSVEDWSGSAIYDRALARDRVAAAAEAAHGGVQRLVLTARAENHIHGVDNIADTIARLQSFQEAGADVLFAPGLHTRDDIRVVLSEIERPLSVLLLPGCPDVGELAELGVARISTGGALTYVGLAAVADAARELLTNGTPGYFGDLVRGRADAGLALGE